MNKTKVIVICACVIGGALTTGGFLLMARHNAKVAVARAEEQARREAEHDAEQRRLADVAAAKEKEAAEAERVRLAEKEKQEKAEAEERKRIIAERDDFYFRSDLVTKLNGKLHEKLSYDYQSDAWAMKADHGMTRGEWHRNTYGNLVILLRECDVISAEEANYLAKHPDRFVYMTRDWEFMTREGYADAVARRQQGEAETQRIAKIDAETRGILQGK